MPIKYLIFLHILAFSFLSLRGQQALKNQQADIEFDESGRIYIRTSINNKEGGLLFDTSSKSSYLADSLINYLRTYNACISLGKQNLFESSEFKKLSSSSKMKGYTSNCLGVIGNNIIEKYTWDFNFNTMTVAVSKGNLTIDSSLAFKKVEFTTENNRIEIPVKINDEERRFTFDSSVVIPLITNTDHYSKQLKYFDDIDGYIYSKEYFLEDNKKLKERIDIDFRNINIGQCSFSNSALAIGNKYRNRIGIPYWHEFERIILNYDNNVMYCFYKQCKSLQSEYSITQISKELKDILINYGFSNYGFVFISPYKFENFNLNYYENNSKKGNYNITVFGNYFYLAKDSLNEIIYCNDSVKLNDGSIKYRGWFKKNKFDGYHSYLSENIGTVNFYLDSLGCIYIDAQINSIDGCMLFDTGAEVSFLDSETISKDSNQTFLYKSIVEDSNLNSFSFDKYLIETLNLGGLPICNYVFTIMDEKPDYYLPKKNIGVIGQNIIKKYIWDFNFETKTVTISQKRNVSLKSTNNVNAINLNYNGEDYILQTTVNNKPHLTILDTGFDAPIQFKKGIPGKDKPIIKRVELERSYEAGFDHLFKNPKESVSKIGYADIVIGSHVFSNVNSDFDEGNYDLLGIPFWHEYKRVVLDCLNNVMYLIDKRAESELTKYSASQRSISSYHEECRIILDDYGKLITKCPYKKGFPLKELSVYTNYNFPNDTVYGKFKVKGKNSSAPVILSKDSLKLSNGVMLKGRYKYNVSDTIRYKN